MPLRKYSTTTPRKCLHWSLLDLHLWPTHCTGVGAPDQMFRLWLSCKVSRKSSGRVWVFLEDIIKVTWERRHTEDQVVFKCNSTNVILHSHKWKCEKSQAKCGKVTWERRRQESRLSSRQSGLDLPTNSSWYQLSKSRGPNHDSQMFKWILLSFQYIRTGKKRILFSASQPTRPGTNSPRGSSVAYFIHFWRTIK